MTKEIIMAEKTVDMPDTQERATQPEDTRTRERYVTPPVDIYETPEGLVVIADVPGVTPDHIDVRVDNHILTIWGQAAHGLPAEPTYREYELVNYFRQFDRVRKWMRARLLQS
jgi:HSP20 family molecular chaperone IbpA